MRIILGAIILILMQGCDKPEASYRLYDSHIYASFIKELDKTKIKYRKGGDYSIFYSTDDESNVEAIADMTLAKYYTGCGGTMATEAKHKALVSELAKQNIPFNVVSLDDGQSISCPEKYHSAFSEAMHTVFRNKGVQ